MNFSPWLKPIAGAIALIWVVFFSVIWAIRFRCGEDALAQMSQMGDAFNILGTLFAGLAFAAVITQLRMHQEQIDEERDSRHRSERISVLGTLIQVTFEKILNERKLLLQVAPGFKNVSFLHEGDRRKTEDAIEARKGHIRSLVELIELRKKYPAMNLVDPVVGQDLQELWNDQAALPMMEQIKEWVEDLESYEREMNELLGIRSKK